MAITSLTDSIVKKSLGKVVRNRSPVKRHCKSETAVASVTVYISACRVNSPLQLKKYLGNRYSLIFDYMASDM